MPSTPALPIETPDDGGRLMKVSAACILVYITIYSLESPIRYLLYLTGANELILARDLLVDIPVALLILFKFRHSHLRTAITVFVVVAAIQTIVFAVNFGAVWPSIFGMKLLVTALAGMMVGTALTAPGKVTISLFTILLIVVTVSIFLEKFYLDYPWIGIHVTIGGYDVEIARDWEVLDTFSKRVGGFTHESISAAVLLPTLALVVSAKVRSIVGRGLIVLPALYAVFLTTQKGALIGFLMVSVVWCMPRSLRRLGLPALVLFGVIADVGVPLFTYGMDVSMGEGGVFSIASFAERIKYTWPQSLDWINAHSVFPFGVGMGGIGGTLRSVVPAGVWLFPDNMAIFLYGYFGIFTILVYGWMIYASFRSLWSDEDVEAELAVLAFLLFYGVVVSIVENQISEAFIGAALGALMKAKIPSFRPVTIREHRLKAGVRRTRPRLPATPLVGTGRALPRGSR